MSGDMADFALEQVMDMEDLRLDYRLGHMSDARAYDEGIIDERGYEERAWTPYKTCKHCRAIGLVWKKMDGKWRLSSVAGEVHSCMEHTFD